GTARYGTSIEREESCSSSPVLAFSLAGGPDAWASEARTAEPTTAINTAERFMRGTVRCAGYRRVTDPTCGRNPDWGLESDAPVGRQARRRVPTRPGRSAIA